MVPIAPNAPIALNPEEARMPPTTDDATLRSTRLALQSVAEHVLSAALHAATGRIGLRRTPGGFGTPPFTVDGGDRQLRVDGTELVRTDGESEQRRPLTTLRDAAALAGIEAGAPVDVYTPSTPLDLDRPLAIDAYAADLLADFYAAVDAALEQLRSDHAGDDPAIVQLWPEHFDLATSIAEVNYGGSPGDDGHARPYLYVGPWNLPEGVAGDRFWNEPFGASTAAVVGAGGGRDGAVADALDFFRAARAHLAELVD
jgi:hypothetical protein